MHSLTSRPSIGVIIPTFQAAKHLAYCLPLIAQSPLKPRILVIDSSSTDQTVAIAKEWGAETIVIAQSQFNHGLTREKGRLHLKTDIVVMLTQDAYPLSTNLLEELVRPIIEGQASVAYARQLPHVNAGFFEAFPRSFNYPVSSHVRGIEDIATHGSYTFFCSNSCAAYLNSALQEIGGFSAVLFGEDTVAVAKLLHRHHKVAYVATAQVRHSHHYSLKQEFCRHFDIGLARHTYQHLIAIAGKDSQRGKAYVQTLISELIQKKPTLIPYALLQTTLKFLGYQLGKMSSKAPIWFKRICSSQKFYWSSH
jgi:rhamnosyltransferase